MEKTATSPENSRPATAIQVSGHSLARHNMQHATLASCCGEIPQVMIKDSSVMIIFAALIGASDNVAALCTGLPDLATVLMLPFAALAGKIGLQRQITLGVLLNVLALLAAATAPWWAGVWSTVVLLSMLVIYAVTTSLYYSSWFALLERVVPPAERGLFFGRFRFIWQLVAMLFIFATSWFIEGSATVGRLQSIIVLAAFISLGRAYFVNRMHLPPGPDVAPVRLRQGLIETLHNRPLTSYSVYLFFLYLAANATVPIIFIFARSHLGIPDNRIVLLSVFSMSGLLAGYLAGGRWVHRYGVKRVLIGTHVGFACLNFSLLTVHGGTGAAVAIAAIAAAYSFLVASASVAVSTELFALASRANKAISIAFGATLFAAGAGGSRALASFLLGSGMLAARWNLFGWSMTRYHSLFFFFGCGVLAAMLLLVIVEAVTRVPKYLPEM